MACEEIFATVGDALGTDHLPAIPGLALLSLGCEEMYAMWSAASSCDFVQSNSVFLPINLICPQIRKET